MRTVERMACFINPASKLLVSMESLGPRSFA
jgi:hypothetical protein